MLRDQAYDREDHVEAGQPAPQGRDRARARDRAPGVRHEAAAVAAVLHRVQLRFPGAIFAGAVETTY